MAGEGGLTGSKNALRSIIGSLPDALLICRPDGAIVDVNATALSLFHVDRACIIGCTVERCFSSPTDPPGLFGESWGRAVEGQEQYFNWTARRPGDGSEFLAEVCLGRLRLEDSDFIRVAVRDLGAQHRTDCVLRGSQATYIEMVQCVNGIILHLDTEGRVRFINRFAKHFFGYNEKEIVGKNVLGTIVPETDTAGRDLSNLISDIVKNPDQYVYNENENMRKNGERVWIAWTNKALVNERGEIAGLLVTGINITDLKRTTDELRRTRDNLEQAVRERTRELVRANEVLRSDIAERERVERQLVKARQQAELYVDLMGHDINNMNQMGIGYLELALESADPEEVRKYIWKSLGMLRDSSKLIENVEKLQLISSAPGRGEVVDLSQVLTDVLAYYPSVPGRDVRIDCPRATGCMVVGNELLKDVFSNLLSNAVKHSTGPLAIGVKVDRVNNGGRGYYRVAIEDNGPGIRDEMKGQLFTRYERGETRARGRGLGLYLVKAIVESFRGKVYVEDRVPGDHTKGSRFVVMLPVASPDIV